MLHFIIDSPPTTTVVGLLLAFLYIFLWGAFTLLSKLLTVPGAVVVTITVFILLLRKVVAVLVFPGATSSSRRSIEKELGTAWKKGLEETTTLVNRLVQQVSKGNVEPIREALEPLEQLHGTACAILCAAMEQTQFAGELPPEGVKFCKSLQRLLWTCKTYTSALSQLLQEFPEMLPVIAVSVNKQVSFYRQRQSTRAQDSLPWGLQGVGKTFSEERRDKRPETSRNQKLEEEDPTANVSDGESSDESVGGATMSSPEIPAVSEARVSALDAAVGGSVPVFPEEDSAAKDSDAANKKARCESYPTLSLLSAALTDDETGEGASMAIATLSPARLRRQRARSTVVHNPLSERSEGLRSSSTSPPPTLSLVDTELALEGEVLPSDIPEDPATGAETSPVPCSSRSVLGTIARITVPLLNACADAEAESECLIADECCCNNQFFQFLGHFFAVYQPRASVSALDLLRGDMMQRLNAQPFGFDSVDGQRIDCMLLPSPNTPFTDDRTVIMCNPNGGYLECVQLLSDWPGFYLQHGSHVALFNYRGYGRSGGKPHPQSICDDAVELVNVLQRQFNIVKVGVHGISVGVVEDRFSIDAFQGVPACHVAAHCKNVSLLVADRSFGSLSAMARVMAGWFGDQLLSRLVRWRAENTEKYISASCPKVCLADPNDEVIRMPASLASQLALYSMRGDVARFRPAGVAGETVVTVTDQFEPTVSTLETTDSDFLITPTPPPPYRRRKSADRIRPVAPSDAFPLGQLVRTSSNPLAPFRTVASEESQDRETRPNSFPRQGDDAIEDGVEETKAVFPVRREKKKEEEKTTHCRAPRTSPSSLHGKRCLLCGCSLSPVVAHDLGRSEMHQFFLTTKELNRFLSALERLMERSSAALQTPNDEDPRADFSTYQRQGSGAFPSAVAESVHYLISFGLVDPQMEESSGLLRPEDVVNGRQNAPLYRSPRDSDVLIVSLSPVITGVRRLHNWCGTDLAQSVAAFGVDGLQTFVASLMAWGAPRVAAAVRNTLLRLISERNRGTEGRGRQSPSVSPMDIGRRRPLRERSWREHVMGRVVQQDSLPVDGRLRVKSAREQLERLAADSPEVYGENACALDVAAELLHPAPSTVSSLQSSAVPSSTDGLLRRSLASLRPEGRYFPPGTALTCVAGTPSVAEDLCVLHNLCQRALRGGASGDADFDLVSRRIASWHDAFARRVAPVSLNASDSPFLPTSSGQGQVSPGSVFSALGALVPLRAGHNGYLNAKERAAVEEQLKVARWIV